MVARFAELYTLAAEHEGRVRALFDAAALWLRELLELQRSHGVEIVLGCGAVLSGAILLNPEWDTFGTSRAGAYRLIGWLLSEQTWALIMIAHGLHWIGSVIAAKRLKRWAVLHCFLACNFALALWGLFALDFWMHGLPSLGGAVLLIPWALSLMVLKRLQVVLRYERKYRSASLGG